MFESKNEIYNLLELEAKVKTLETSLYSKADVAYVSNLNGVVTAQGAALTALSSRIEELSDRLSKF